MYTIQTNYVGEKTMSARTIKIIRNIVMLIGMIGGFVIWLFVPDTIRNSALFHVGNGSEGSKIFLLLLLPLPLFSLFFQCQSIEYHGKDEEYAAKEQEKSDRVQMLFSLITAFLLSAVVISLMLIGLSLKVKERILNRVS